MDKISLESIFHLEEFSGLHPQAMESILGSLRYLLSLNVSTNQVHDGEFRSLKLIELDSLDNINCYLLQSRTLYILKSPANHKKMDRNSKNLDAPGTVGKHAEILHI